MHSSLSSAPSPTSATGDLAGGGAPATARRAGPAPSAPRRPPRALEALAASVLCFAAMHVAVLVAEAALRRDLGGFNIFTMLEAQRLWPALASGSASAWASLGFGLAVYGTVFAILARRPRRTGAVPGPIARRFARPSIVAAPGARPRSGANGAASNGASPNGADARLATHGVPFAFAPARVSPLAGWLALAAGLGVHVIALVAIERLVPSFPPVPDVVHERLPYVDFGVPGELAFATFMAAMLVVLFRRQPRTVPAILVLLGAFYALRGVFLFLLPIGIPPTAPPLSERFVFWPFAAHGYFPGGHTGMMTVLSLSVCSRPLRRAFLAVTFAFAIGTLLARTHYAADAFGGWLVGYTITLWGRRRFGALAGGIAASRETTRPPAARQECEA